MLRSNYSGMNRIERFFCYCSGASLSMLKRCPTETSKFVGIGATVFFTGILASISSAFALHFVFDQVFLAIGFGLIWGLMIFNLDRFIVLSMRKGKGNREYWQALPRFILAILIAVVISKPLELKVFEKEIGAELNLLTQELQMKNERAITRRYEQNLDSLKGELAAINLQLAQKQTKRDELYEIARQEADGTGGSGKINPGPIYKIKKKDADRAQQELDVLFKESELKKNLILVETNKLLSSRSSEMSELKLADTDGIFFQLTALKRLGDKYAMIYLADWFIMLLFIALEISPILVKILSPKGPYDDLLEVHEQKFDGYRKEKVYKEEQRVAQVMMPQSS